jgi:serine/threonine protein kinase
MPDDNPTFEAGIYGLPYGRPGDPAGGREPLEVLATEFVEALREGRHPDVADYEQRHPELAAEIAQLFPLLAAMEAWKGYRERTALEHRALRTLSHERFGSFRIVREIGRGSMGIVFEAQEQFSPRRVAIKVFPFLTSSSLRAAFDREARTAARLRHPRIVPVYSVGEHEGMRYYVMRLIRGVSLDWLIRQLSGREGIVYPEEITAHFAGTVRQKMPADDPAGPEPLDAAAARRGDRARSDAVPTQAFERGLSRNSWHEFARIVAQLADALEFAHRHGTLHRDIKPANLLLDAGGDAWITDFGLARDKEELLECDSPLPAGTLRYMAPEQFAGRVDVRSDVYSLGVSLYELLTRTPAFTGPDPRSLARSIVHSPLPKPTQVNPRIPRHLEAILLQATAKDPAQRYASAGELAADLLKFAKAHTGSAKGAGWFRFGK